MDKGNDNPPESTPKARFVQQGQGKRKIKSSKKEPNGKSPCPWKPRSSTWIKGTNSPVCREKEVVVVPPPCLWWDSAIVTHGMVPTLQGLKGYQLLLSNAQSVLHIQQTDQWSCGFRNIQMLMSGLVPLLPSSHPYFQSMAHIYSQQVQEEYWLQLDPAMPHLILPSLTQLQQQLEACWKEGFDPDGANHFKHSVVGGPSPIGAVEVGSLFSFWWLDACVVEFIKCFDSRHLLAPFVYRYFCSGGQQPREKSLICLDWAEKVCPAKEGILDDDPKHNKEDDSTVLPMYLQWEGHSVTVVGIEPPSTFSSRVGGPGKTNWSQWNLLVFCPNYNCSRLATCNTTVAPFRLPCSSLLQKDCQLLLCSQVPLTSSVRMERKILSNAITAAKDAVMDFISSQGY